MEMRLTFRGGDTLGFRSNHDSKIWVRDVAGGVNMVEITVDFPLFCISPRGPVKSIFGSSYANFTTQWIFIDDPAFLDFMENIEEKKDDTILIEVNGFITWKSFMHIIIKHCEEGKNTRVVFDRPQVPVTNCKGSMHATSFGNSSAIGSIKDVVKVEDRNTRAIIDNIM